MFCLQVRKDLELNWGVLQTLYAAGWFLYIAVIFSESIQLLFELKNLCLWFPFWEDESPATVTIDIPFQLMLLERDHKGSKYGTIYMSYVYKELECIYGR